MAIRFLLVAMLFTLACGGCSQPAGISPLELAELRARFALSEEPAGVLPVLAAVDAMQANPTSANSQEEVVVLGRIGGVKNPCDATRSVFVMTDPTSDIVGSSEHDGNCDCHFCQKSKADLPTLAIVELVDEQGQAYPYSVQQLADLAPDQMVVVRGRAKLDALGNLSVAASGVYVRR
jgi:hypothetical protein